MKKFLILSFLNSSFVFAQAPSLDCHLSNGTEKRQSSSPLLDGQSEVKGEELGFLFDASLASQSYLSIFEDQEKERRVAFAGSPEATSGSGSKLTIGNASLQCVQKSPSIGFQIPAATYTLCLLDEAIFEKGAVQESKRLLAKQISLLSPRMPFTLHGKHEHADFVVVINPLDQVEGLKVTLKDEVTGELVRYSGPARSFGASFLFGLTLGNRNRSARFLRLGCVRTNDPSSFF